MKNDKLEMYIRESLERIYLPTSDGKNLIAEEILNSINKPHSKIHASIFSSTDEIIVDVHPIIANSKNRTHSHDFFELMYVYKGKCTQNISSNTVILEEGDICLLNTNTNHSVNIDSEDDILFNILIKTSLFEKSFLSLISENDLITSFFVNSLFTQKDLEQHIIFQKNKDSQAERLIQALLLEGFEKGICYKKSMECYLALLFAELLRNHIRTLDCETKTDKNSSTFTEIISYINENQATATLKSTSEHFHYHPNYLSSLIKKYTNKNFSEIVQTLKINQACNYLVHTDISIDKIIEISGYYDRSYFNKVFKKQYNMTPSEYRQKYKNR